jgi:hypothetical protein
MGYHANVFGNYDIQGRSDFFRVTRTGASGIIGTQPDPLGKRIAIAGGATTGLDTRHLWYPPETANSNDDEFDSSTLDTSWVIYDGDTGAAGTISSDEVNIYDTSFTTGSAVRINANTPERRSWALIQPPGKAASGFPNQFALNKAYTLPTNVLIWARLKFAQRITQTNDDHGIGIAIADTSGGLWDEANFLAVYVNESDVNTVQGQATKVDATVLTTVGNTTDIDAQGQALEYAAIHKLGSTYHFWVGTAAGNWIYLGNTTISFTPDRVGIVFSNVSATSPGSMILGCDFIRFVETDTFKL